MASEVLSEIPRIDLADFEAGGQRRDDFVDTTIAGLHDTGFVFLRTPQSITDSLPRMYDGFRSLFSLPKEVLLGYEHAEIHHQRGYNPIDGEIGIQCRAVDPKGEDTPNHAESWFSGPADVTPDHPFAQQYPRLYAPNIWPDEVPELEGAISPVYDGLYAAGRAVLRTLEPTLGKEAGFFDDMVRGSSTVFRPLHYPAVSPEESKNKIGACQHTDINLVTVLPAPTRAGLEVMTRNGRWIPGTAAEGFLLVQVGDMLQRITGGYFLSAQHRVASPVAQTENDEGRYSSALFVHPAPNAMLEVIPKLTETPELYPPIEAADFLTERLIEIGLIDPTL